MCSVSYYVVKCVTAYVRYRDVYGVLTIMVVLESDVATIGTYLCVYSERLLFVVLG